MKKCVIIGAAGIQNYERLKTYLSSEDFYIFCDGGLAHQEALGVVPNLIVGDFDSWKGDFPAVGEQSFGLPEAELPPVDLLPAEKKELCSQKQPVVGTGNDIPKNSSQEKIIRLPTEKDDTDLFYAAKYALNQGFTDFLILGAIGQRFDHSLCNISLLFYIFQKGRKALIVDDYAEMQIIGQVISQHNEGHPQEDNNSKKNITGHVSDTFSFFSRMCVSGRADGVTIKNAKYPLLDATIQPEWQYAVSNQVLPGQTAEITVKSGQLLLIKDF